jgi:hypothetical protein
MGSQRKTISLQGYSYIIATTSSLDGKMLLLYLADGTVLFLDAAAGVHLQTLETKQFLIRISFSEDSQYPETM